MMCLSRAIFKVSVVVVDARSSRRFDRPITFFAAFLPFDSTYLVAIGAVEAQRRALAMLRER